MLTIFIKPCPFSPPMGEERLRTMNDLLAQGYYKQLTQKKPCTLEEVLLVAEAFMGDGDMIAALSLVDEWASDLKNPEHRAFYCLVRGRSARADSRYTEAVKVLEDGLALLSESEVSQVTIDLGLELASVEYQLGRLNRAEVEVERVINQYFSQVEESTPNSRGLANNLLGIIRWTQSRLDEALTYFHAALDYYQINFNPDRVASVYNNMGLVQYNRGALDEALSSFKRSLKLREKMGINNDYAMSLNNIANIYQDQGFLSKALELHRKALEIRRSSNDQYSIALSLNNIGELQLELGLFLESIENQQQALQISKDVGNPMLTAAILVDFARVLSRLGDLSRNSVVWEDFPPPPYETPTLGAYKEMIRALLHQAEGFLAEAEKGWLEALSVEGLEFSYKSECFKSLAEVALLEWTEYQSIESLYKINRRFQEYEDHCVRNNLLVELCKLDFIQARFELSLLNFDKAYYHLNQCQLRAENNGLPLHQRHAQSELSKVKSQMELVGSGLSSFSVPQEVGSVNLDDLHTYLLEIGRIIDLQSNE